MWAEAGLCSCLEPRGASSPHSGGARHRCSFRASAVGTALQVLDFRLLHRCHLKPLQQFMATPGRQCRTPVQDPKGRKGHSATQAEDGPGR